MNRRLLLSLLAIALVGGTAGPALAATALPHLNKHVVCVTGSQTPTGPSQGVCVWAPLPVSPGQ